MILELEVDHVRRDDCRDGTPRERKGPSGSRATSGGRGRIGRNLTRRIGDLDRAAAYEATTRGGALTRPFT